MWSTVSSFGLPSISNKGADRLKQDQRPPTEMSGGAVVCDTGDRLRALGLLKTKGGCHPYI